MKNLLLVIAAIFITSCQKQASEQLAPQHLGDVVLENKSQDEDVSKRAMERRKTCPPNNPHCQTPPPSEAKGCLLFDFDGEFITNTLWNVNGDFNCEPSGLNSAGIADVLTRSRAYFSFNPGLTITTYESIFKRYPNNKRLRIVITATMPDGFQNAGGAAYLNSFNWFNDTPAFVNSSGLGYNSKWIADASSHEAGHGFALRHQSSWQYNEDGSCVKLSDYLWGDLIMGASYNYPSPRFGIGPNSLGCYLIQNDTSIINQSVRL